jgi:hypothetical protein
MQSIGEVVTKPFEKALTGAGDRSTRRALMRALPTLKELIEKLCPVVMAPEAIGYGPFLNGQQRAGHKLFLFANAKGHAGAVLSEWPDQTALEELAKTSISRSLLWAHIDSLIETCSHDNCHLAEAVCAVAYLAGSDGRLTIEANMAAYRRSELFPAICSVMTHDKKHHTAAGAIVCLPLPMPIDTLLADTPTVQ